MNRNSKNEERETLLPKYVRSYKSKSSIVVDENTEKILNHDLGGSEVLEDGTHTETQEPYHLPLGQAIFSVLSQGSAL